MKMLILHARTHRRLLLVLACVQVLTSTLPLAAWFTYTPDFSDSWIASISQNFSNTLTMFWLWLVAATVIGVGAWWSRESGAGLYLELWRSGTFRRWLGVRLAFASFVGVWVLSLGLAPVLVLMYPAQAGDVLLAVTFLGMYVATLSALVMCLSLLGIRTAAAVCLVLLIHTSNVLFDGIGLPNVLRFFLIAEDASAASAVIALGGTFLGCYAMLELSSRQAIMDKGCEER